jgi:membrane-associated phospholipid phosphatase
MQRSEKISKAPARVSDSDACLLYEAGSENIILEFSTMKIHRIIFVMFIFIGYGAAFAADTVIKDESAAKMHPNPFTNIFGNAGNSMIGYNIPFHSAGVASTYILVKTDTDYRVHNYFAARRGRYAVFEPAIYIGYMAPAVLGGGLYATGLAADDVRTSAAGCAVIQSTMLAVTYSSLLKVFTGRPNPDEYQYTKKSDRSHEFNWGFMRNGVHYGWPSGHMMTTTAIAACLMYYYNSLPVKIAGLLAWGYMAFGITSHEGNTAHWFSDVVAGSLMGFAIGSTVGKDFRIRGSDPSKRAEKHSVSISPVMGIEGRGFVISFVF